MKSSILKQLYLLSSGMVFLLFGFLPLASVAQEITEAELEADHALTKEFATPHIQWGKPYAYGKTRTLFFVGERGTVFREGVELLQRFDLEMETVIYSRIVDTSRNDWHGGQAGIRRIERLLEKDWDAYLFLGVSPAKLPGSLRKKLVDKIKAGRGIVLSGADDPSMTPTASEAKETFPFLSGIVGVKPFALGKGRVVRLPARPNIEYAEGWQNIYETWQEGLGRALLWAAGKEPQGRLSLSLSRPSLSRTEAGRIAVCWENDDSADRKAKLQLWIREPVGWSAPWPDQELKVNQTLELTMPLLPAGYYHLDGRVIGAEGVMAWATTTFEVVAPQQISAIDLNNDWGEVGDKITGKVVLIAPSILDLNLRIEVLDKDRRVLMRHEISNIRKGTDFSFTIPSWLPMLTTIEASLWEEGKLISKMSRYFRVTTRNHGRFNFLIWDVPRGTLAPYAEEILAQTGITLQLAGGIPPLYSSANQIAWVPYTTHIISKHDANGIMTPFCWNDRTAVDAHTQKLADQHMPSRQHGVFVYSLGDEISTQGACIAKPCLDAYRSYLKEVYGNLAALNTSWGTHFQTWEEVGLLSEEDNEEKSSFKSRNYPRWFDRQAFKSWNFVQYARKYAMAYRAMDSQAKTGFEGAGRFVGGDDIDLIVRNLGFWSPYPGTTDEVIRSIAPRDFPRANWMGYTKDADSLLLKYWRMVTRGMDSVWWWRWECIGKFHGWLAPDFRPYPAVKEILEDTKVVREGLGDLLIRSQMQDDGIAILYSYPSTFAHKLDEGTAYGEYEKAHTAWHKAIRDLGLQFTYVTDRMLRLGEFNMKRFRILVLPRTEAIGEKEAEVIRTFVEKGGLVIADTRPGIYDDHCKKREAGVLDSLFGVHRTWYLKPKTISTDKKVNVILDPGIVASDGSALSQIGGTPVFVLHRVGKGHTLLINGNLDLLNLMAANIFERFGSKAAIADDPLGAILQDLAGINAKIALKRENGSTMRDVEVIRWKNGENEIFALFRQGGRAELAKVELKKVGYVYDLRSRKFLGRVKQFRTDIIPNRASFFIVSLRPAPTVQVKIGAQKAAVATKSKDSKQLSCARGTVVKVWLSAPRAKGNHAVLVTARFPKPSAVPPRFGAFFPRSGYPVVPVAFPIALQKAQVDRGGAQGGGMGDQVSKAGAVSNLSLPIVYPGVNPEKGEFLKRAVIIGRKPVTVDLPIAFNDPTGNYKIIVTDLFTQKSVIKNLTVQ